MASRGVAPNPPHVFAFRPWVRSACRKAMLWGVGVVGAMGLVAWVFRTPGSAPLARAFGVLALYGLLFLATLLKIWWTAGRPAVVVEPGALVYQPLHGFRPRRIDLADVVECGPKPETQSLRFLLRAGEGEAREFFINLGLIQGRNEFLDLLGEALERRGLTPARERHTWHLPVGQPALLTEVRSEHS